MKKFFLLLALVLTVTQAQAFEDYIIMSDKRVDFIKSQNDDIVSVIPFYTIDNTKNIVFVKAKQVGKTQLDCSVDGVEKSVKIEVLENKTILSEVDGLSYFVLDMPEEPIEILPPPSIRGGK